MGLTLSAITRLWTQYRYDKEKSDKVLNANSNVNSNKVPFGYLKADDKTANIFKEFIT